MCIPMEDIQDWSMAYFQYLLAIAKLLQLEMYGDIGRNAHFGIINSMIN